MGCCDGTSDVEEQGSPFKKVSQRGCTDIICLITFLAYTVAMIVIAVIALGAGDINYLLYPLDYKDQFCGHTEVTKNLTKAYYPRLDRDLLEQKSILYSPVGFYKFTPYTLCVKECPPAYTIAKPVKYGGPSYPSADTTAPSFYASFKTREVFSRCLPTTETALSKERELCTLPACGTASLVAELGAEAACTTIDSQPTVTTAWEVTTKAGEKACQYQVKEVVQSTFLPEGSDAESRLLEKKFAEYVTSAFTVIKSLTSNATPVLVMGIGAPFGLALIWFAMLYCFAGVIVVVALLGLGLVLLAGTAYLYYKAGIADQSGFDVDALYNYTETSEVGAVPEDQGIGSTAYAILAVCATVVTLIYFVMIVVWQKAVGRCIAIVREVSKVIFSLPFMVVWPLVGIIFFALIAVYLVIIGGYIGTMDRTSFAALDAALQNVTSGDESSTALIETGSGAAAYQDALEEFTSVSGEVRMAIFLAIHIIGVIWAYWVTELAVYTTLSRSAAVWYYSHGPHETTGEIVQKGSFVFGFKAVLTSAWCVFSRHVGSVAFAGAILTIFTVIRLILEGAAQLAEQKNPDNLLLKMVIKCTKCAVWCLEKTVQMVTYFGMIFVAIEGQYFCKACYSTFNCWSHYPAQVAVNKLVGRILSLVISLSIPAGCAFASYIWIDNRNGYEPWYAAIAVALMAYVIAAAVTDVFRCAVDTIFICVFYDLEQKTGPKHMSIDLQKGFDIDESKMAAARVEKGGAAAKRGSAKKSGGSVTESDVEMVVKKN